MQELLTSFISPISIIIFIIVVAVVVYLLYTRDYQTLRAMAYKLMVSAEQNIRGNKKGQERFNVVLHDLYNEYIPYWLKIFISEEQLKGYLQKWYYEIEGLLNANKAPKPAEPLDNTLDNPLDNPLDNKDTTSS